MPICATLPHAGSSDSFDFREFKSETLKPDEIRIKVHYSGINFADIHMRLGLYKDAPKFPFVPGYEVCGEIIEVHSSLKKPFSIGEMVIAGTYFGGYASEVIVSTWQAIGINVRSDAEIQKYASLPVSFITSYFSLIKLSKIQESEAIFIDCITGSLGQMMVQVLKKFNVSVYGLTSSRKKYEFYKEKYKKNSSNSDNRTPVVYLGDYKAIPKDLKFDVIINSHGGNSINHALDHLNPFGRVVCIGASDMIKNKTANYLKVFKTWWSMRQLSLLDMMDKNIGVFGLNVLKLFESPKDLEEALEAIKKFDLTGTVDCIYKFDQLAEAHSYIENRKSHGKVLLKWI